MYSAIDVPVVLAAQTPHVTILCHQAMQGWGLPLAAKLKLTIENQYKRLQAMYVTTDLPVIQLVISNLSANHTGLGGGYHYGDAGTDIYTDVRIDPTRKFYMPDFCTWVFFCEMIEIYSARLNRGWSGSFMHGEAMSRVLSNSLIPGAMMSEYMACPVWLNSARKDYLSTPQSIDGSYNANVIGCNVCALYWFHNKLGIPWATILAKGGTCMEDVYKRLVGRSGCYAAMMADLAVVFPRNDTALSQANENVWDKVVA